MWRYTLILLLVLPACGGSSKPVSTDVAPEPEVSYSAEDFASRAELARSVLTTEVDERRYRAAAPAETSFSATEPTIYLVGKLKNVPTQAEIEVRWFIDASNEPILVSEIHGSSTLQFIASFKPAEGKFDRGTHTARIFVNDTEIDSVPFEIYDDEIEAKGPKVYSVALSKKVNKKNKPKAKTTQFQKGTKKVFVSFGVKRTDRGSNAEINWTRGESHFHNQDIKMSGDRRYSGYIHSSEGLPSGGYRVEISINGKRMATKSFVVGKLLNGPSIEKVELGLELDSNNMPKDATTVFNSNCGAISCGLCFLDLDPNSVIELQWIQIDQGDEIVRYTNRTELPAGGEGIMGAAWEPDYSFETGTYKLVVLVNGEPMAEQLFEVE